MTSDPNPTNQINISSITGGVNNIGSQVENQTVVNHFGGDESVSLGKIYEIIAQAIPTDDAAAVEAARKLLELEAEAKRQREAGQEVSGEHNDQVIEQQTLLARYKPQIVAALQEMGLAWLQTAFPMVAFVRPLIKIAIDAWNEGQ